MSLAAIISGLKVQSKRYAKKYAAARSTHVALAPYETIGKLFELVAGSSPQGTAERITICNVALSEHRKEAHPLWQAVLLVAYEPLLRKLAAKLARQNVKEADEKVAFAFIDALGRLAGLEDPSCFPGYVRTAVERSLFREMNEERGEPETVGYDEDAHGVQEPGLSPEELIDLKRAFEKEPNAKELAEMLYVTVCEGQPLHIFVDERFPELTREARIREYERLRKQRRRLLLRLRDHLTEGAADAGELHACVA